MTTVNTPIAMGLAPLNVTIPAWWSCIGRSLP